MKKQSGVKLAGSFKSGLGGDALPKASKDEEIEITVRLRRKQKLPEKAIKGEFLSREDYERNYGAALEDAEAVEAFAHENLLSTVTVDLARRSVILSGKLSDMEAAFEVDLKKYENEAGSFRVRSGDISIPAELQGIVIGVFGLDNRPVARPMFQMPKKGGAAKTPQTFTADKLAAIYGFPMSVNGKGQCIGIIELGGGFRAADITNYFKGLGIPKPTVKAIAVDKAKNAPSNPNGADGEVMLDIEVAGAVAPGAKIAVYFAPNTDKGFLDAITQAIHDKQNKPSVISISWGSAEVNWTDQAMDNFSSAFESAGALGVTICIAAGDSGSSDGETDGKVHVDFPASSPYALSCGGTSLTVANNKIVSEVVWHDSNTSAGGGGVSGYFALPDYQANANVPLDIDTKFKGRGVPDVAGNADPNTGYKVLVDGEELVIGGTSAVAPLMAGLIALINEQNGKSSGFIHPQLYATPSLCRDITGGDNKTTKTKTGYTAGIGWDACTGLGVMSKL